MEECLKRIAAMEAALDESGAALGELNAALERMDALREAMMGLYQYYGSEDWFQDRERTLPPGTKAGVLSEDAVYDQITELREAAFHMLDLAADILKNRI